MDTKYMGVQMGGRPYTCDCLALFTGKYEASAKAMHRSTFALPYLPIAGALSLCAATPLNLPGTDR